MPRLTYGISLPILRAFAADDGTYRTTSEILGTCFSIGEGHMLTAHHVVENWNSDDSPMVVGVLGQQEFFSGACIMNTERLVGDIALIKTELPRHMRAEPEEHFITAPWAYEPLSTFARIRTIGYPYGLDHSGGKPSVVARGFEGHVVSRLKAFQRPGSSDEPVTAYELSFPAERGLSGSPLLSSEGQMDIRGVVIGNSESQIEVFRSVERSEEGGAESIYERYEAMTLGIAVAASAILPVQSSLLGMTIQEHLEANEQVR